MNIRLISLVTIVFTVVIGIIAIDKAQQREAAEKKIDLGTLPFWLRTSQGRIVVPPAKGEKESEIFLFTKTGVRLQKGRCIADIAFNGSLIGSLPLDPGLKCRFKAEEIERARDKAIARARRLDACRSFGRCAPN